jgi:hypothetical protein
LFRVATGASTIAIYLRDRGSFVPVWAIAEDSIRPTGSMQVLSALAVEAMIAGDANLKPRPAADDSKPCLERAVVRVPPSSDAAGQLAVIVCDVDASRDASEFHRRADEMGRTFATILHACSDVTLERRP